MSTEAAFVPGLIWEERCNKSVRPTNSSTVRNPNEASISRNSSAIKYIKCTTCCAFPLNKARKSLFWVATPTGHVSLWQTRIMTHPNTTNGAVANPNSSAPSAHAYATSLPVSNLPSVSNFTRLRKSFNFNVWCVSAKPISQGTPACWILVLGDAPVPPS